MLAAVYVCGFVATLWLPFVCADARSRAPPSASVVEALAREANPKLALLLLFNAVNALICVWEIALWTHRANVQKLHRGYLKKFGNRVLPRPLCLFEDITLAQALSLKHWSIVFAQYASLDPSYVQHTSWSFWIDVGNGFTMLVPTVALSIAVTSWPEVPMIASFTPRSVGIVAIVMNYQMFYGTVMYYCNYCYNRYDVGASATSKVVVFAANLVWIVGPLAWIFYAVRFVHSNSLAIV